MAARVIDVLRRFLPAFLREGQPLHEAQHRAVWALAHCRTPALGGHLHACADCGTQRFSYHSCNHRACPQCGRAATAEWIDRELGKRVAAPYFMVTFTLPSELRSLFFGKAAKEAFDLLFAASSGALGEALASPKGLGAAAFGFTGVLHTWNQRLGFHPHVHFIVPGAGLDAQGRLVKVRNANFLAPLPPLRSRFRRLFREGMESRGWQCDPSVWTKDWGVHVQPFGSGENAIKYLGAYVSRTAIGDSRIVACGKSHVAFRWSDRANGGKQRTETVEGVEFVRRYLRHVLPRGLRSIRHYGFCHPAAKAKRERVAFLSGRALHVGPQPEAATANEAMATPLCPCCRKPMMRLLKLEPAIPRGPPLVP